MAANKALVRSQVLRFRSFPNFPDEAGQLVLIRAFSKACETDEQVRSVADHLENTVHFSPLPADIHEAAEAVANRNRYQSTPTFHDTPGEFYGTLTDGMSEADAERWKQIAENGKTKHSRAVAKAMVDRYNQGRQA